MVIILDFWFLFRIQPKPAMVVIWIARICCFFYLGSCCSRSRKSFYFYWSVRWNPYGAGLICFRLRSQSRRNASTFLWCRILRLFWWDLSQSVWVDSNENGKVLLFYGCNFPLSVSNRNCSFDMPVFTLRQSKCYKVVKMCVNRLLNRFVNFIGYLNMCLLEFKYSFTKKKSI